MFLAIDIEFVDWHKSNIESALGVWPMNKMQESWLYLAIINMHKHTKKLTRSTFCRYFMWGAFGKYSISVMILVRCFERKDWAGILLSPCPAWGYP
jgi:hypothetical protein